VRALDLMVCPGCGRHGPASAGGAEGWSCDRCGYEATGRPPTLSEMMDGEFGDWDDVNLALYARKVVALVLIGADQLNPAAARSIGLAFLGSKPSLGRSLLPLMASLSAELAAARPPTKENP